MVWGRQRGCKMVDIVWKYETFGCSVIRGRKKNHAKLRSAFDAEGAPSAGELSVVAVRSERGHCRVVVSRRSEGYDSVGWRKVVGEKERSRRKVTEAGVWRSRRCLR